ncbi:MAG: family 20 glycosylhydrolase [Pyrinomonadaceae bacterium]
MNKFLIAIVVMAALAASAFGDLVSERRNLMPVPKEVSFAEGKLRIDKDFSFAFTGHSDGRLSAYLSRVLKRLEGRTLLEFSRLAEKSKDEATLMIDVDSGGNAIPKLGDDESYELRVESDAVVLNAETSVGAMRGLETLLQLVEADEDGFYFPLVSIKDEPRFAWRGLMIDSARHFQPIEVIKRNLDAMAAVKLNVLHWHLTEDQGFRPESKKFPELHLMGSDGDFYTQEEMKEIVRYAADRGIRVMPEFDMPGHATAWLVSHPEIASGPGPYEIERRPGVFNPTLDPTNPKTYKLLEKFLAEMAKIFPDRYMHIGGDENEGKQWDANQKIQAFMKKNGLKNNHELQTYFNRKILKILTKNGKVMMGWDEIFQPDLPKEIVIHSWRGQKALADAAKQGYTGVLSNGYYIDLMHPASEHYKVDPLPADSPLNDEEKKRVLGGEATMWAEWVTPETIDSRIWPRTAAIAERFWSPQKVNEPDDMYRRLNVISIRLEELGLTHIKNQDQLLRRISNGQDIGPLKKLVGLVAPVRGYRRYQILKQSMLFPLTGLIDASQADPADAMAFDKAVEAFLESEDKSRSAATLLVFFDDWKSTASELRVLKKDAPALQNASVLPDDLEKLSAIGREAVESLRTGKASDDDWRTAKLAEIDEIRKQKAGVEWRVIGSMLRLVRAE